MWKIKADAHKWRTKNQRQEKEKGKLKAYAKCRDWYYLTGIMVEIEMHEVSQACGCRSYFHKF